MPVDFGIEASDPKHDAIVLEVLKRLTKTVEAYQTELTMMQRWTREPKPTAKMGIIAPEIYGSDNVAHKNDRLASLPEELRAAIVSCLEDPADRLMYALTAKSNAATVAIVNSRILAKIPAQLSGKRKPVPSKQSSTSRKVIKRMPAPKKHEQLSILLRLERDWMPAKWKLCYKCLRFIPKGYRVTVKDFEEKGRWMTGKSLSDKTGEPRFRVAAKEINTAMDLGPRCPDCAIRVHFETQKRKKELADFKKSFEKK